MGQSKDGGYMKQDTGTPQQQSYINQILSEGGLGQQAMEGVSAFLPGGKGFEPIANQARQGFQEQTLPAIMEALGSGVKSSSGLNQTMGQAGQGLESQLASLRAQMMQQAAGQGMQASMGAATDPQFMYQPRQLPFWQKATLGGVDAIGKVAAAYAGS